jgi:hypothetical protein
MPTPADRHGTRLITALDRAYSAVRKNHPELPEAVLVTGRRRNGEGSLLGQHCCDTWFLEDGDGSKLAEIYITGEVMAMGPNKAMTTVIHEAAHALARVRGVKDTSNKNRYHNKEFARLATELGLEPPKESGGPAMGFSACVISEETCRRYLREITAIAAAGAWVEPAPLEVRVKKPKRHAECGCGEEGRISWTRQLEKRKEEGRPVTCGVCGDEFEEAEGA